MSAAFSSPSLPAVAPRARRDPRWWWRHLDDWRVVRGSALFAADWYRARYPDVAAARRDPARHYVLAGAAEGRDPGPDFDTAFYLRANPDVARAGLNPLVHYLRAGRGEGRRSRSATLGAQVAALAASGLFDPPWYVRQLAAPLAVVEPIQHYLEHGAAAGLSPGPGFDGPAYLERYPDVAQAGANPLLHYVQSGRAEGRAATSVARATARRAVLGSGHFDAAWYARRHALDPGGVDPLDDYLDQPWPPSRAPGPMFDPAWYLGHYPDTADDRLDPLVHYARHGAAEGRSARNLGATDTPGETRPVLWAKQLPLPPSGAPPIRSIVVVVHAFYPEIFPEIVERLRHLPMPFTLLVGVPDEAARAAAVARVAAVLGIACDCRVVPNRGRNFGSLIAEFGAEVLRHDVVLHLHTKRSLYSGYDRAGWRASLYQGLIGSAPLVRGILGLMQDDPRLGLCYPQAFDDVPYWAHHWLRNAGVGQHLLARVGVPAEIVRGLIDYPVGAMFWARVDAIRPLLAAGLGFDDFPEELGQTDGTLAHACERAVGVIARARGYGFCEIDHEQGIFRHSWSERGAWRYHPNAETLRALATPERVVSFDVFDTLLTRPAMQPDAALHLVGHRLRLEVPEAEDFFARRKQAEADARADRFGQGDVGFAEIYGSWRRDAAVWRPETVQRAAELELAMEAALLRPRPGMVEAFAAAAATNRVILISDTYFPPDFLMQQLHRHGFPVTPDQAYFSCEQRARKDRGDLWPLVLRRERLGVDQLLHVGDNPQSDAQAAGDLGIPCYHVMAPADLIEAWGFVPSPAPPVRRWPGELVVGPAVLRLAGDPFQAGRPSRPPCLRDAADVGYTIFGPPMFLFTSWLARHPALREVDHLYFCSREGYALRRAYELVRQAVGEREGLPASSYFYTSRRLVLAASQAVAFEPERVVGGPAFQGDLHGLVLHRLGLDLSPEHDVADWRIDLPRDAEIVARALAALRDPIVAHGEADRSRLLAYARQTGMLGASMPGVVDVGYSATIQAGLQRVLRQPLAGFYLGTYATANQVEAQGGVAFGCLDEGIVPWTSRQPMLRQSLITEAFLTAPHGQVLTFEEQPDGAMRPLFKPPSLDLAAAAQLEQLHDGAIAYCRELLETFGADLVWADIDLHQPQEFMRMLQAGDLRIPPEVAAVLRVEDDFSGTPERLVGANLV